MSILHVPYTIVSVYGETTRVTDIWSYIQKYRDQFTKIFGISFNRRKIKYNSPEYSMTYSWASTTRNGEFIVSKSNMFSCYYEVAKHKYIIYDGFGRIVDPAVLVLAYKKEFGDFKYKFYEYHYRDVIGGKPRASDCGDKPKAYGHHRYAAKFSNIKNEINSADDIQHYSSEYGYVSNIRYSGGKSLWDYECSSRGTKSWKKHRSTQYKNK